MSLTAGDPSGRRPFLTGVKSLEKEGIMRKVVIWGTAAAVLAAGLIGCTATRSVQQASNALKRAEEAGAESKSPYSYYLAREYLSLAEHESFEFDAKAAKRFAQTSVEHSEEALRQARGGAQ